MMIRRMMLAGLMASMLGVMGTQAQAKDYKLDKGHTYVYFKIKHMGLGYSYGRFNEVDGKVTVDGSNSKFDFTIKTDSIDTGIKKRDSHLKSPDFFNERQYPLITFKTKSVKVSGDKYTVTGDLTMHGKTKSITVDMTKTGESDKGVGFEAIFVINSHDFGIKHRALGKDVTLMVSFEANP